MISSKSFRLLSRKITCLSFNYSCSSDAFSYACFLSGSEDLLNFFPLDKSFFSSSIWIFFLMVGKACMSLALTNVYTALSNFLKKKTNVAFYCWDWHFLTIHYLFISVRLSRSNTDEEALMIICVFLCSCNPLFFSSVAICWGARRWNFKLGTKGWLLTLMVTFDPSSVCTQYAMKP